MFSYTIYAGMEHDTNNVTSIIYFPYFGNFQMKYTISVPIVYKCMSQAMYQDWIMHCFMQWTAVDYYKFYYIFLWYKILLVHYTYRLFHINVVIYEQHVCPPIFLAVLCFLKSQFFPQRTVRKVCQDKRMNCYHHAIQWNYSIHFSSFYSSSLIVMFIKLCRSKSCAYIIIYKLRVVSK